MRQTMGMALMALILTGPTAVAQSSHRLVVIVAEPNDPRAIQENTALQQDDAGLRQRDVVVQKITPEAARRDRADLGVGPDTTFEVLLVGKDGRVKLRRENLVAPSEITALIDTMPMRQEEMKQQTLQ